MKIVSPYYARSSVEATACILAASYYDCKARSKSNPSLDSLTLTLESFHALIKGETRPDTLNIIHDLIDLGNVDDDQLVKAAFDPESGLMAVLPFLRYDFSAKGAGDWVLQAGTSEERIREASLGFQGQMELMGVVHQNPEMYGDCLREVPVTREQVELWYSAGVELQAEGQNGLSIPFFLRAAQYFFQADPYMAAISYNSVGNGFYESECFVDAVKPFQMASTLLDQADPEQLTCFRQNIFALGTSLHLADWPHAALPHVEEAVRLLETTESFEAEREEHPQLVPQIKSDIEKLKREATDREARAREPLSSGAYGAAGLLLGAADLWNRSGEPIKSRNAYAEASRLYAQASEHFSGVEKLIPLQLASMAATYATHLPRHPGSVPII